MMNLIRVDDDTDHGGKVVTGSTRMRNDGRFVARKRDHVSSGKHPDVSPNVIEEGDTSMTDGGISISRHGHRGTYGCHLISSFSMEVRVRFMCAGQRRGLMSSRLGLYNRTPESYSH